MNYVTEVVRKVKYSFENDLALNIRSDPKKFWNYVNRSTKVKQGTYFHAGTM